MISRFTLLLSIAIFMSINVLGNVWIKSDIDGPLKVSDFTIVNATCNPTGSITYNGEKIPDIKFLWKDEHGNPYGDEASIDNLSFRSYLLTYTLDGIVFYTLNFIVKQQLPNVATQNDLRIPCGESTIRVHADEFTGGKVSSYRWEDELGNAIGSEEFILLKAGQYYLTIKDESGFSSNRASILVKAASLRPVIDISSIKIISSGCIATDGAITGIKVSSTESSNFTYIWRNSTGEQVSDLIDLIGVPAGKYRLTTKPINGECETISAEIEVQQKNPLISSTNSFVSKSADCELPNGGITGVTTNATSYRWIDVEENTVATTLDMINVKEGYYKLILSNEFGCQEILGPFHVKAGNPPIIMQSQPVIKSDSCSRGIGSILGARVIASGIKYSWTDGTGKEISRDPDLRNVTGGNYMLTISNPSCSQSYSYQIDNIELQLAAPVLEDKFVCSATGVLINFNESAPLYRIYDSNGKLLQESKNRNFMLDVKANGSYFGALSIGSCESARTAFNITVGETALNIPSSFTPNNDGTNDTWVLKGIEVYNTADIKIFNRYGNLVYHSTNPADVFTGKKDGNDLPAGVYYYIIKLTNDCKPFTGSLTLLR
jgi:gliding motility-associated-like protein